MENAMTKLYAAVLIGLLVLAGCASKSPGNEGPVYAGGASGTGTGTAEGFTPGGMVTVTVTLDKGKLVNVVVDGPHESAGVGSRAVINLPVKMMEKKSIDIDGLSGVTYSSNAILQAAKAAVEQIK